MKKFQLLDETIVGSMNDQWMIMLLFREGKNSDLTWSKCDRNKPKPTILEAMASFAPLIKGTHE